MKISLFKKLLIGIGMTAAINLSASAVQSVLFEGDYGGNRSTALVNQAQWHYTEDGDFNGDGATDFRTFIPLLFPYPGLDHGPYGAQFGIDQDLFGVSGLFYVGATIASYSPESAYFPPFGLLRYAGSLNAFQMTSGLVDEGANNVAIRSDMGMLASYLVIKDDFLNGADEIDDLRLPNEDGAFYADFFFRGLAKEDGIRRGRFIVRVGDDTWYISGAGTENIPMGEGDGQNIERPLSSNPAADYWYEYDGEVMLFIEEGQNGAPTGTGVRGDLLTNITAVGIIYQHTRFDGSENHTAHMRVDEFGMKLDPDPEPIVDVKDPWLDTGDWLGELYNEHAPWVYSSKLKGWIYLPDQTSFETGGWIFIPAAP